LVNFNFNCFYNKNLRIFCVINFMIIYQWVFNNFLKNAFYILDKNLNIIGTYVRTNMYLYLFSILENMRIIFGYIFYEFLITLI